MRSHVIALIIFCLTAVFGSSIARADVRDLKSLAREVRYALHDHGRALSIPERKSVRFELATTIVTIEKITGRRARAGYTLEGLATTAERIFEQTPNNNIAPVTQKTLERRLVKCLNLLERRRTR